MAGVTRHGPSGWAARHGLQIVEAALGRAPRDGRCPPSSGGTSAPSASYCFRSRDGCPVQSGTREKACSKCRNTCPTDRHDPSDLNQGIVSSPAAFFGGKHCGFGRAGINEYLETKYVALHTSSS